MFKRFLKFLKGEEEGASIQFEGSYLEHLFERVRPFVNEALDECPDHDPHLLVVIGLLRATMLDGWSDEFRRPLVDATTIGVEPPPPPETEPESAATAEVDVLADTEAADGDSVASTDSEAADESEAIATNEGDEKATDIEVSDEDDDSEVAETIDDDFEIVEEDALDVEPQRWSRITEEINVSEIAATEPVGKDSTREINREAATKGGEPPRPDTPQVLQAGRVFLSLLLDNDSLPTDLQLNVSETALARDLLLGYFGGSEDFEGKAKRLLSLVEKKFGDGLFSQARILLHLFHTDEQTRVNNDRNLFYEDMILRLGIRRRHPLSAEERQIFADKLKASSTDEGVRELARWMDEVCLVKFHLLLTDRKHEKAWKKAVEPGTLLKAKEAFLERIPPKRWRTLDAFTDETIQDQIVRHVDADSARNYILGQVKTCYFILRAVGDTGLEGFLDTFLNWTESSFGINGTTLMPVLYNRSMQETLSMNAILDEIYDIYFADGVAEKLKSFDDETVIEASRSALKDLSRSNLSEFAPGYYDLGGFVFDHLFGVEYPTPEFASKVHRIT